MKNAPPGSLACSVPQRTRSALFPNRLKLGRAPQGPPQRSAEDTVKQTGEHCKRQKQNRKQHALENILRMSVTDDTSQPDMSPLKTSASGDRKRRNTSNAKTYSIKTKKSDRHTFQHFQNFRFSDMTNNISKDVPIICLVYFEVCW